jgi:signal transduction histidine kinase
VPGRPWLAATIATLVVTLAGAHLLATAIDRDEQQIFDTTVDVFERVIEDQVGGYVTIGFVLPAVLGSDSPGLSVDQLYRFLTEQEDGRSLIGSLPLDGFAGLGFVARGEDDGFEHTMLPNSRDINASTLREPAVMDAATQALLTQRPTVSEPLSLPIAAGYVYAVPVSEETVALEFLDLSALLEGAGSHDGVRLLEATATDVETGLVVGESGSVPPGVSPNTVLSMSLLGRPLRLDVHVGAGFSWDPSWIPGVSMLGLGFAISILIYAVGVVSRRRNREQERRLRSAEQMIDEKDRFIAAVSHELRTPLTAVVGFAAELSRSMEHLSPEEAREIIAVVAEESMDMALLVEDLLVAAQIDNGAVRILPEVVNVDDQIAAVRAGLGPGGPSFSSQPSGFTAWADPLRIRQILRNLVLNAIRHGGDEVEVRAGGDGTTTWIEVIDDGAPIPAETQTRMFDTYYHAAIDPGLAPSVGLGLSVSRSLARMMDGDLTYRHREGFGIFRLEVPAVVIGRPRTRLHRSIAPVAST